MGNPEFNGKKFDYWTDYTDLHTYHQPIYGVWNNDMKARQYIDEWRGTLALSKEAAIEMAKSLNLKIENDKKNNNSQI